MKFINNQIFGKDLKQLSKKYPKVETDLQNFLDNFSIYSGTNLGKGIYKFRLSNSSNFSGKRGGFRLIIFFIIEKEKIIPIAIYSKTERENMTFEEIVFRLQEILKSL